MNSLYNHPKVKAMVSLTKGEGFGRPLLEFTLSGKPVIASNWSGHKDFLSLDHSLLIGGKLTDVHESAVDNFIIKGSKWFTANYSEASKALELIYESYETFLYNSKMLKEINETFFSLENMTYVLKNMITKRINLEQASKPTYTQLILPKLNKIEK